MAGYVSTSVVDIKTLGASGIVIDAQNPHFAPLTRGLQNDQFSLSFEFNNAGAAKAAIGAKLTQNQDAVFVFDLNGREDNGPCPLIGNDDKSPVYDYNSTKTGFQQIGTNYLSLQTKNAIEKSGCVAFQP